jgi:hypothetical protein
VRPRLLFSLGNRIAGRRKIADDLFREIVGIGLCVWVDRRRNRLE